MAALQLRLLISAGTAARAMIAADLSDAARETALAGIRRRHPELSEQQVAQSFLALMYGCGKEKQAVPLEPETARTSAPSLVALGEPRSRTR